jgi:outer membrane protein OmpA-like peptidoglycan-associated protein
MKWIFAAVALASAVNAEGETRFHKINFDANSAILRPDSIAILHEGADLMIRNPEIRARIEGSACPTEEGADELWFQRAIAARTFLIQHGVSPSQIVAVAAVSPKWQADTIQAEKVECSERLRAAFFVDARTSS